MRFPAFLAFLASLIAVLCACLGGLAPAASAGGTYQVSLCAFSPAPLGEGTDRPRHLVNDISCNNQDLIQHTVETPTEPIVKGSVSWTLKAPLDTLIAGLSFQRGDFGGLWFGKNVEWQLRSNNLLNGPGLVFEQRISDPLGNTENPPSTVEEIDIRGIVGQSIPQVSSVFGCTLDPGSSATCESHRGFGIRLREPVVTLEDPFPPDPPTVTGSFFDPGPLSGTKTLTLSGADRGSGLGLISAQIDSGQTAPRFNVFDFGSECGPDPARVLVPCALSLAPRTFEFPTARIPNGQHIMKIEARDHSGQITTITRTFETLNPPEMFEVPRLQGKALVGQTLTSGTGGWWLPPSFFGFTWLRCPASVKSGGESSRCSQIPGASGKGSYVVTSADVGARIIVKVSASNSGGTTDAFSDPTEPVTGGADGGGGASPPRDTTAPTLSRLSLAPKRLRLLSRSKPKRTNLRFISSEAGTLTVAVSEAKAKKPLATIESPLSAGAGKLAIGPKVGKVRLRPGRYKLTISARDAAGNVSAPVQLTLAVVR